MPYMYFTFLVGFLALFFPLRLDLPDNAVSQLLLGLYVDRLWERRGDRKLPITDLVRLPIGPPPANFPNYYMVEIFCCFFLLNRLFVADFDRMPRLGVANIVKSFTITGRILSGED